MDQWRQALKYWFDLARVRDETGLPVDLIYLGAVERDALPRVIENHQVRPVTEAEFHQGIKDCIAVLQGRSPKSMKLTSEMIDFIKKECVQS